MSRTLLITGASTGIGQACALAFDREGWTVFAAVRREEDGRALAARASSRLAWLLLDVTNHEQITTARDTIEAACGDRGLDALVNNAGVAIAAPMEFVPRRELRHQFDVNVFGLVDVTQSFLPLLRKAKGRIVNIGSIAGRITTPLMGPYCASKHAVEAITDALRLELDSWGIQVSVIEPGAVATPIWEKGTAQMEEQLTTMPLEAIEMYDPIIRAMSRVVQGAPRRAIPPEEVVNAVRHALGSPKPRPRYVVGRDAKVRLFLQSLLPRRWMDSIIHRFLNRAATQAA
ncbi:MAG TPA: SDR family oxidoreductase [Gemmatimonadales bacterium]|nr:SDR family oxidoreductase [Gemmatimonadales bacterium]